MNGADYIVLALIAVILGLVILYIIRSKKKGSKCIGCPDGTSCSGNCANCPGHSHK